LRPKSAKTSLNNCINFGCPIAERACLEVTRLSGVLNLSNCFAAAIAPEEMSIISYSSCSSKSCLAISSILPLDIFSVPPVKVDVPILTAILFFI